MLEKSHGGELGDEGVEGALIAGAVALDVCVREREREMRETRLGRGGVGNAVGAITTRQGEDVVLLVS